MSDQELVSVLALQNVSKIGDITAKKLIAYCGSAEAVFKEKKKNLLKIDGIGSVILSDLFDSRHLIQAEEERQFINDKNIVCHYFADESYPEKLKQCIDGPILLFQSGNINLNRQPIISIVGARKITSYGITVCKKLVEVLAPFNPIIVSGFAYGTDITAQKAAVKHNLQTIGCLAHGLDQIYPETHKRYVADIEKHGGFFTDFWSTSDFNRNNFLKRNRIIAGLSEATIVIESAEKGGSLVTADIANSYNREVFAIPGRITDSQSVGCNNLIKYQKAHALTKPEDVPYILNWELGISNRLAREKAIQKKLFVNLEVDEQVVYDFLKNTGKEQLDIIALRCNMPTFRIASLLLNMELKGVIRPLPGKQFEVI